MKRCLFTEGNRPYEHDFLDSPLGVCAWWKQENDIVTRNGVSRKRIADSLYKFSLYMILSPSLLEEGSSSRLPS